MLNRFQSFIAEHRLLPGSEHVVVGISGGVDSMVLLDLLVASGYRVIACHVNYHLRGTDADDDEAFVRSACERLDVPFHVHHADPASLKKSRYSVQAEARRVRYGFFRQILENEHARHIAVAHHLDDQVETLLLNLFRGTGLQGLAAMRPIRKLQTDGDALLIRPLLWARRSEIEQFARERGIAWREDATNESVDYRRNAVRNELMPVIVKHFGEGTVTSIARTAGLVRSYLEEVIHPHVASAKSKAVERRENGSVLFRAHYLASLPRTVNAQIVLDILHHFKDAPPASFELAEDVLSLVEAQTGSKKRYGRLCIWREREGLLFRIEARNDHPEQMELLNPGNEAQLAGYLVKVTAGVRVDLRLRHRSEEYMDEAVVSFPLKLRRWEHGDVFQPLGLEYNVKLSDFLTDARVSASEKSDVLVLESDGRICCVIGHRIDHRFRVTDETKNVVKIAARRL